MAKRVSRRPPNQLRHKFIHRMASFPDDTFRQTDFKVCGKGLTANTILTTLHNMKIAGQVKRVGLGSYKITAAGKKLAKQLNA